MSEGIWEELGDSGGDLGVLGGDLEFSGRILEGPGWDFGTDKRFGETWENVGRIWERILRRRK